MHVTTLIVLGGKMTWGGRCDFYAGKMFDKVVFNIGLWIPGLGSCVPMLGICLNTSKVVKHIGVLCHEKSFANLRWYLLLTWDSDNWTLADFLERCSLSREQLGHQEEVDKGCLGQCLTYFWLENTNPGNQLQQLALVWTSSRVLKSQLLCVEKKPQLEQVRWWFGFALPSY